MMQEVKLKTLFGNEVQFQIYEDNDELYKPLDSIAMVFHGKGLVLDRKELVKLQTFLEKINHANCE